MKHRESDPLAMLVGALFYAAAIAALILSWITLHPGR